MAHILVIDDQDSMRSIISQMLEDKGHQVATAEDGEQGLKIFETTPAAFDLIMCDVNMPKLDGFEFLQKVKKDHPQTPVILLTGTNPDMAQYIGKEYKANAILKKPFIVDEVMEIVGKLLKGSR